MTYSLGKKINELRREKGMTQETLAERMGVTPQAVSKWENDLSAPDIQSLPLMAELFGVTTDELLGVRREPEVRLLPEEERDTSKMLLRIIVDSADGDRVRVNLPLALVKTALNVGLSIPTVTAHLGRPAADKLGEVDLEQVFRLVEKGAVGRLVEVESADGDSVSIVVE